MKNKNNTKREGTTKLIFHRRRRTLHLGVLWCPLTRNATKGQKRGRIYTFCLCIYAVRTIINSLRPRQNGRHFPDDIFNRISLNENVWIPIKIPLKLVPKGPINIFVALVQIMVWCRLGDKPLYEPRMVSLPTHICTTRPQWVKDSLTQRQ